MADEEEDRGFLGIPGFLGDLFNGSLPSSNPMINPGGGAPGGVNRPIPSSPVEIPRLLGEPTIPAAGPFTNPFTGGVGAIDQQVVGALVQGDQRQQNEARMAEIAALLGATSGGGGGGSNNGARAAAFNAQRDAQVGAYGQQIVDLESQLTDYLAQVQALKVEGLKGVNTQTKLAKDATRKQRNDARSQIDEDLIGLLAALATSQQNIQAEGAATTANIDARSLAAAQAQSADTAQFSRFAGAGDRLAAAALEGQDTNRQLQGIDAGLVSRLAAAASADAERRQGSARQVTDGANQHLESNTAQVLQQITAQAAANRTDLKTGFAERALEARQSYAQQISAARAAQSQAAAQRYIPTATSGGGSARLNPLQQLEQNLALEEYEGRRREELGLTGPTPSPSPFDSAVDYLGGPGLLLDSAQTQATNEKDIGPLLDMLRLFS